MYRFKPVLRIPGPVPVPNEVSLQMAKPMINHRGAVFKEHYPAVLNDWPGSLALRTKST